MRLPPDQDGQPPAPPTPGFPTITDGPFHPPDPSCRHAAGPSWGERLDSTLVRRARVAAFPEREKRRGEKKRNPRETGNTKKKSERK